MTVKKPETDRYLWNGTKKQKADLVWRLKEKQLIKRKKDCFDLFDQSHETLTMQWNSHLNPTWPTGFTAYFAYAEKHFTDFEGNGLGTDTLKKLSTKIKRQPEKYPDLRGVVEDIVQLLRG